MFLFVLVCNLLGMFPFMGSPTASFTMTAVLAFGVFIFIHVDSIMPFGVKSHLLSFAPHMDMPLAMKLPISDHALADRVRRPDAEVLRVGGSSVREHVCRPYGAGDDPAVHSGWCESLGGGLVGP